MNKAMKILNRPFPSPFDRGFMDEFFSPQKYFSMAQEVMEGEGTKDKPYVIHRKKVVDNVYHGWYDDDGSYHETLVKDKK